MDIRTETMQALGIEQTETPDIYMPSDFDAVQAMAQEARDLKSGKYSAIRVDRMYRLSGLSQFLRPGTVAIIGGDEGSGKTFFGLECLIATLMDQQSGGYAFYMPLEGRLQDIIERVAMRVQKSWVGSLQLDGRETDDDKRRIAQARIDMLSRCEGQIRLLQQFIANPPGMDAAEKTQWELVAAEATKKMAKNRLVIIDNLSFVNFSTDRIYQEQGKFINLLLAGAQKTNATCLLLHHTGKRKPNDRGGDLTSHDLGGSVMLSRAADAIILINSHDDKESVVYRAGGAVEVVNHNKTIYITKARHGKGGGKKLAYRFGLDGPLFDELGVIKPNDRG